MMLKGKHIVAGITGSIAAYKAAVLVRLLVKEGAEVKVVMTALAKEFITPLTMATLSRNPVLVDFFDPENGAWNSHVDLGLWADALLIAPATANTIAGMAAGTADNLLLTTCLSVRCPVFVAPAMDMDMFRHAATTQNIQTLRARGVHIIEPSTGELASGLDGKGRMEEPEKIVRYLIDAMQPGDCAGKKVLVTAGPTYEPIDPVRFVGNRSSGRMGYALAEELAQRGAEVILVSGPTALSVKHPAIRRVDVQTAAEMYRVATEHFPAMDAAMMTAAVADFTPAAVQSEKIKDKRELDLKLVPTKDIAAELGAAKRPEQVLAGFALETHNETENAVKKLAKKNFDFIVLNSLNDAGAGFGHDTNKITIIDKDRNSLHFELKSKDRVAKDIVDKLVACWKESS
jgi:phosphopantothenoylcysteine decarboxylase/phosphopantothenate--cysteine ligase